MNDFSTIQTARVAFKELYNQVQSIFNWDLKGSRLVNVANGVADTDAVNISQLNQATGITKPTVNPSTATPIPTTTVLNVVTLSVSKAITVTVDNVVDIGATAIALKTVYSHKIQLKDLTASLPVKTDASKFLITGAIDLSSAEVTGIGTVAKGFTGLGSLTAHNVLLGNGTSPVTLISPSTATYVLTSNGASADPSFQLPAVPSVNGYSGGAITLHDTDITPIAITPASLTLLKLTGGGSDGSITINAQGRITAYTAPT